MSRSQKENEIVEVRVELKYCEHCGGLWVRQGGAGVYCDKCRAKVEELPVPKKKPGKVILPVRRKTEVERLVPGAGSHVRGAFGAAGGAA